MTLEIALPRTVGRRAQTDLFRMSGQIRACQEREIILDGRGVEFIDPQGLTVLGALVSSMPERTFRMPWLPYDVCNYMSRMNFFELVQVEGVNASPVRARPKQDLVELTRVSDATQSDAVANLLADAVTASFMAKDPAGVVTGGSEKSPFEVYRYPIWYALTELIENAVTHAKRYHNLQASVWVAAQYYSQLEQIHISVVDNGCGILRTLATHSGLKDQTHLEALRLAIKPKVSCNRDGFTLYDHGNQGVGLTTSLRIAGAAKGGFVVTSGNGQLVSSGGPTPSGVVLPGQAFWDGVAISFYFSKRDIPAVRLASLLPPLDPQELPSIDFR